MNKTLQHCLSILVFLLLLIGSIKLLDFLLVPMSRSDFFIHDMERMKKEGPNIDLIIIGNSRYLYGFMPSVFEEVLGFENVYNASVTGLEISSKYYITEKMISDFEPRAVLFEIDWNSLYDRGPDITQSKLLGLDRLTGLSKIRHIVNDFYPSEMIYALIRPYRYRDRLFWDGVAAGNIKLKKWAHDTGYKIDYYQTDKGYDKGLSCAAEPFSRIEPEGNFDETLFFSQSKNYLDRIAELCRSRNIPLFLVTAPVSTTRQLNIGNYQGVVDYYSSYAREKGVYYFNMNMLKDRDEIFNDSVMSDAGHLCEPGAAAASKICAEIIRDTLNGADVSGMFYSSMDELIADIDRVAAVGADIEINENRLMISSIRATAGPDMNIEFDVLLSKDGSDFEPIYHTANMGDSFEITVNEDMPDRIFIRIVGKDVSGSSETYADYTVDL